MFSVIIVGIVASIAFLNKIEEKVSETIQYVIIAVCALLIAALCSASLNCSISAGPENSVKVTEYSVTLNDVVQESGTLWRAGDTFLGIKNAFPIYIVPFAAPIFETVREPAGYCSACGAVSQTPYCLLCGQDLETPQGVCRHTSGSSFCGYCGEKLNE